MPRKRCRGQAWRVYWSANYRQYEVVLGQVDEAEAELARREIAVALQGLDWPAWALHEPAVRRYLAETGPGAGATGDLLARYRVHLEASVSADWAQASMASLLELCAWAGCGPAEVTPAQADGFMSHVGATPGPRTTTGKVRSAKTRNDIMGVCRRFYRWTMDLGVVSRDPFAGVRRLAVADRPESIDHLSRAERDVVLTAADGLRDGVGVWLAVMAGLRKGEVVRASWGDVQWEPGRLVVGRTKTGRRRVIPLASRLLERLAVGRGRGGRIVPWGDRPQWSARELPARLRKACPDVPAAAVAWNGLRHTFGSLLVQAGVSLDKVASWMGNTPAVCRRHYAEFVPRGGRDEDIERL